MLVGARSLDAPAAVGSRDATTDAVTTLLIEATLLPLDGGETMPAAVFDALEESGTTSEASAGLASGFCDDKGVRASAIAFWRGAGETFSVALGDIDATALLMTGCGSRRAVVGVGM